MGWFIWEHRRAKERRRTEDLHLIKGRKSQPQEAKAPGRRARVRAAVSRHLRGWARAVSSPVAQLAYAAGLAVGGAWLIALWAVGLVIILFSALLGVDAVLRDGRPASKADEMKTRHEEILQRWREAR